MFVSPRLELEVINEDPLFDFLFLLTFLLTNFLPSGSVVFFTSVLLSSIAEVGDDVLLLLKGLVSFLNYSCW